MSHAEPVGQLTEIERVTLQAVEAAERGDWDRVEACVERRGALMETGSLSVQTRDRLVMWDARVSELAEQARTAIGVLLMEAGQTRRKLQQLHQGQAGSDSGMSPLVTIRA